MKEIGINKTFKDEGAREYDWKTAINEGYDERKRSCDRQQTTMNNTSGFYVCR